MDNRDLIYAMLAGLTGKSISELKRGKNKLLVKPSEAVWVAEKWGETMKEIYTKYRVLK